MRKRKIKVLICGLLACVSVFAFSGCANKLGGTLKKLTSESVELGQQMGKETVEALLENEHSKSLIVDFDEFVYSLLVKIIG